MPDENEDGTNEGGTQSGGGGLRKQLEDALAANKTMLDELQGFRAEKRASSVREVLTARGVPAGAAKFYTDTDVSEAAVDKWLKENEGVFGPAQSQQQQSTTDERPEANAARRVADASHSQPEGEALSDAAKVLGDPEELLRLINDPNTPDAELERLGILPKSQGRNVIKGGYVEPSPAQFYRR